MAAGGDEACDEPFCGRGELPEEGPPLAPVSGGDIFWSVFVDKKVSK